MPAGKAGRNSLPYRRGVIAPPDAVTVLSIYMVLMYVIPSDRRIGALGTAGAVSVVFATFGALWWCWHHLHRSAPVPVRTQPVRTAQLVLLAAVLAGYVAAALRPLPTAEATTVDSSLLRMIAWSGILLVANDGIPDASRLLTMLRRLSWAGGLTAMLGLLQFATGQSFVSSIQIPGLSGGAGDLVSDSRGGFARAIGTSMHPLEYGSVLCIILPIALTIAIYDVKRGLATRWIPPAAIAIALVLSVSRSAILVVLVGLSLPNTHLVPYRPPLGARSRSGHPRRGVRSGSRHDRHVNWTFHGHFRGQQHRITHRQLCPCRRLLQPQPLVWARIWHVPARIPDPG